MKDLKKKILIVDDDGGIRESVRLAIEELDLKNVEIVACSDATSGIEQLTTLRPDIIILDLHLPDKSGFEFMDILNSHKNLNKTKVIMLTVDDTMENVYEASSKGVDAFYFLGKPYNISDLQALVLSLFFPPKK